MGDVNCNGEDNNNGMIVMRDEDTVTEDSGKEGDSDRTIEMGDSNRWEITRNTVLSWVGEHVTVRQCGRMLPIFCMLTGRHPLHICHVPHCILFHK
jgi:hypothetical protein